MKKMLVVFLIIFAAGCAKKYVKAPEEAVKPEEDVRVEEVEKMEEVEEVKPLISPREAEEIESSEIRDTLFEFQDALFDYDKYDIRPDAREALDSVASWLSSHKEINILIEGHCDERGTNEYNLEGREGLPHFQWSGPCENEHCYLWGGTPGLHGSD
jgi:peptidoglycan-associated lipoprotein